MGYRIEFTERYRHVSQDATDEAEKMGLPTPKGIVKYRRIYPKLEEIFAPKEIPETRNYCLIEFNDGSVVTVKGSYDDICILIDDAEREAYDCSEDDLEL